MKLLRILMSIAVLSLASAAFAQSHEHDQQSNAQKSDAQKSFDQLKTLAGSWEGHAKVDPPPTRHAQRSANPGDPPRHLDGELAFA